MRVELTSPANSVRSLDDLVLTATITNDTGAPVRLDTRYLEIPTLVFDVRDAAGNPVPRMPPPVPWEDDGTGRTELKPADSVTFTYRGSSIIAVAIDPGDYRFTFQFEAANIPPAQDWEGTLRSGELVVSVSGG
jgi:hypothetical protein